MRRKDREITDLIEIYTIMKKCDVCRVAFYDDKYPYIIPMNFGVVMINESFKIYFHCATVGTKLELLKRNPYVAFEMDCSHKLLLGEVACNSTMEYESVCGNGEIRILEEKEKIDALTAIMNQYQVRKKHEFNYNEVMAVKVLELTVNEIHGKRLQKIDSSNVEEVGSLSYARKYSEEGRLEEWVQKFLRGTGKNLALASGLLHEKRYYIGPVQMPLNLLDIPEGAPYYLTTNNDIEWFFQVTDKMIEAIEDGWDMPPLIVNYDNGVYESTDGRHRFEALRKMGKEYAYVVIWTSSEQDYEDLKQKGMR